MYALAKSTLNHKHKINLNYNGATVEVFLLNSERGLIRKSARHFRIESNRIESNRNRPIRIRIEYRSFAGP